MKLPKYMRRTKLSYSSTERDPIGCEGLYIEKLIVKWWAWPFIVLKAAFLTILKGRPK